MSVQSSLLSKLIVVGGFGDDLISGEAGDDLLTGGAGRDTFIVSYDQGSDIIGDFAAGPGGDRLQFAAFGFADVQSVRTAMVQAGPDVVIALPGGETLTLKNVDATSLSDENFSFAEAPIMDAAPPSPPSVTTSAHSSLKPTRWLSADSVGMTVTGSAGNDQFSASVRNVTLVGGAGDDTYIFIDGATTRIIENADEGVDTVLSWYGYELPSDQSIENLTLAGSGNISGTGNGLDNMITGNGAANTLDGGKGNDILTGGGGNDVFLIGKGNGFDTITDFAVGGAGADIIRLKGFGLSSFASIKSRATQSGADTIINLGNGDGIILKNVAVSELGSRNFQFMVSGSDLNDTLEGGAANDYLTGGRGRDTFVIRGGRGSDTISDFTAGANGDFIQLTDLGFASFAAVIAASQQIGGNTVITLPDGNSLTLLNVQPSKLTEGNFTYVNKDVVAAHDDVIKQTVLGSSSAAKRWLSTSAAYSTLTGTIYSDQMSANAKYVTLAGGLGDDVYILSDPATATVIEKAGEGNDTVQSWYSYALANDQSIENLVLAGTSAIDGVGNSLNNLIIGNSASNVIRGGTGSDTFTGGGGADTFIVSRGEGMKTITDFAPSGGGADIVRLIGFNWSTFAALKSQMAQFGNDVMIWLGGNDSILLKNVSLDALVAGNFQMFNSADIMTGTSGADIINGGDGDDILAGGAGRDEFIVEAGNGSDTITDFTAGSGGDFIDLRGYDVSTFAALMASARQVNADTVLTMGNGETLTLKLVNMTALSADNFLLEAAVRKSAAPTKWLSTSGVGTTLSGSAANDQLSANARDVTLAGGSGDDTYIVADASTTTILEQAGDGVDTVISWYSYQLSNIQSLENLTLAGANAISGTGNWMNNIITGNAANNVIAGGTGSDTFTGNGGNDTFMVKKGEGMKTITDFAVSGSDADTLLLDGFDWSTFTALKSRMTQIGNDVAIRLGGDDIVLLKSVRLADLQALNFQLKNATDWVFGTDAGDVLNGGDGNDYLTGGGGRDTFIIDAGNGSDTIEDFTAGSGGDFVDLRGYATGDFAALMANAMQAGANTVLALGGGDTLTLKNVTMSSLSAENFVFEHRLPATGYAVTSFSSGSPGTTLTGTTGNDYFTATANKINLIGGAGDDTYVVAYQTDLITENAGEGTDTVITFSAIGYKLDENQSLENLTLMGTENSTGWGNWRDNFITGNDGRNSLNGGAGNDILYGRGGADIFIVNKGEGSDIVGDFTPSEGDVIRLDGFGFNSYADIVSRVTQVGSNVLISLGNGQTLTLQNMQASALNENSFAFTLDRSGFVQTFRDDFDTLSLYRGTSGTWVTKYEWPGATAYSLTRDGSGPLYVDPNFRGLPSSLSSTSLGLNPFSIADGKLTITSSKLPDAALPYAGGYRYASGLISSEATFAQTYGYFEMKAELPAGSNAWPAFWMLAEDNDWPPELDIFETFGNGSNAIHSGSHSKIPGSGQGDYAIVGDLTGSHAYGVAWTPYTITFYVDGKATGSYATPADMNKAMYLIANLSVGNNADPFVSSQLKIDQITAYQLADYTLESFRLKTSGAASTVLSGTAGSDWINGTSGNDLLGGNGGNDTLVGGDGDDTYVVSSPGTQIRESLGAGVDTVISSVSWTLGDNLDNLTLSGGDAINGAGNLQSNIITGNDADNVITGGGGNDVLTGQGGADTFVITRGDGSDIITDFDANDVVALNGYAFSSFDQVKTAMSQHGADTYLALSSFETLVFRNHLISDFWDNDFRLPDALPLSVAPSRIEAGSPGDDTLIGTASNNYLDGMGGNDLLIGGKGDDTYKIYAGTTTTIVEQQGEGVDTVEAYQDYSLPDNVENLKSIAWYLKLNGNDGANRIWGAGGNETLNGKGGNDWLFGGAGNDTFVHERDSGFDVISDFHVNTGAGEHDLLVLSSYGNDAYLTHSGDIWTVHYAGGQDQLQLTGVTQLSTTDYRLS